MSALLTPVIKGATRCYTLQIQIKGRNHHLMMERMGITTVPQNSAADIKVNTFRKEAHNAVPYLAYLRRGELTMPSYTYWNRCGAVPSANWVQAISYWWRT